MAASHHRESRPCLGIQGEGPARSDAQAAVPVVLQGVKSAYSPPVPHYTL
jgi:hypothetical protein